LSLMKRVLITLLIILVAVALYLVISKTEAEVYQSTEFGFEISCPGGSWREERYDAASLYVRLTCAKKETPEAQFINLTVKSLNDVLREEIQCVQTNELLPAVVLGKEIINNIDFCKLEEDSEGDHFLSYIVSNGVLAYEIVLANKYLVPANTPSGSELGGFLTPEEFEQYANGFFKEVVSSFRFLNPPFNPRD